MMGDIHALRYNQEKRAVYSIHSDGNIGIGRIEGRGFIGDKDISMNWVESLSPSQFTDLVFTTDIIIGGTIDKKIRLFEEKRENGKYCRPVDIGSVGLEAIPKSLTTVAGGLFAWTQKGELHGVDLTKLSIHSSTNLPSPVDNIHAHPHFPLVLACLSNGVMWIGDRRDIRKGVIEVKL